jgi:hypothetical protein
MAKRNRQLEYIRRKEKELKEREMRLSFEINKLTPIADKLDEMAQQLEAKKKAIYDNTIFKNEALGKLHSYLIDLTPLRFLFVLLITCIGILALYFGYRFIDSRSIVGFWFLLAGIIIVGMYMITYAVIVRHNKYISKRMSFLIKNKKG